jgi:catechol 2,3-dioxygenase-like lactoylglutathione lyase family enzyme
MGLGYTAIRVKDVEKSLKLYRYLGLKVIRRWSPIPGEKVVQLADKKTRQRLNMMWYSKSCRLYTPWKKDGVELDHLMFHVKDAKKTYEALLKKGHRPPKGWVLHERVRDGKLIRMGFVLDPNGIWVGVASGIEKA